MKDVLTVAAWFLVYGVVVLIGVAVTGLVLSASWTWFVAPITGLRPISISEGIGLMFFLGTVGTIITAPIRKWDFKSEPGESMSAIAVRGFGSILALGIFGPLAGLIVSWAWHTFVIAPPGG